MMEHHGVGLMVWSPLSSGFLTGKYTRENPQPEDARLNSFDLGLFDRNWAYDVVDKVKEIAANHSTSPTSVALAWLLSKNYASSILVGVSKLSQLKSNLDSISLELSVEEIKTLDEITAPQLKYPKTFQTIQDQVLKDAKIF
jgi:aryl-alcohol dehydrogenase-like predicted oxidoreductase